MLLKYSSSLPLPALRGILKFDQILNRMSPKCLIVNIVNWAIDIIDSREFREPIWVGFSWFRCKKLVGWEYWTGLTTK